MRTAIITGIDGTGKSTLINQLYVEHKQISSIKMFSCPSYHIIPGSGVEELSILFEKINNLGNELKHSDIKALGLFLQMSLYSCVLNKHKSQADISLVISERHAILDTAVYGAFYAKRVTGSIDINMWKPVIEKELEMLVPKGFEIVENWILKVNEMTKEKNTFWNYTGFLKRLFSLPPEFIIADLSRYFQLEFPDEIIFLRIESELAVERLRQRNKQLELHETTLVLDALQQKYIFTLDLIKSINPNIVITLLDNWDYEIIKSHLFNKLKNEDRLPN